MSPLLTAAENAGIEGIRKKRNPFRLVPDDFFNDAEIIRKYFSEIINCEASQVAIIPSASYGLSSAIKNISSPGKYAVTVSDEFPSGYYTLQNWCIKNKKELKIISPPDGFVKGKEWNERLISSIDKDTAVVMMSSVHWTDGTLFDLKTIGKKCKESGAYFIVDGTQSVGAMRMDVSEFNIDALICAAYKWLLGPYSIGLAYYGERFNDGEPVEYSWMTRSNAKDFSNLTAYVNSYNANAARYNSGEFSNFIMIPMIIESLKQIIQWGVENINSHCGQRLNLLISFLKQKGFGIEDDEYRSRHFSGFHFPKHFKAEQIIAKLQEEKVFVSLRKSSIRVSPHVYNDDEDVAAMMEVIDSF
jgi:selenocysteine lyase/cysteine desulfurase